MPPLEQNFVDLEVGSNQSSVFSRCGFAGFFSSPRPKTKKSASIVSSAMSQLEAFTLSDSNPPSQKNANGKTHQKDKAVVKFSSGVRVRLIPSHKEISKDQKQKVWYSAAEARAIRVNTIKTVEKMAQNKSLDPNETTRGLENMTPSEHQTRRILIRRTILTVLKEQSKTCSDPAETWKDAEHLARIYGHACRHAVSEAICLAAIDTRESIGS
ncbi:unnamed protein product [Cylindrotheca closterium]|uniref:Uncharacterized protein n=1 Tax=Cylindrotheca closterium TaxID=2856 RepID=A0AAD2FFS3_9STRA|nr:unnamed protein product [Cylindrotheca closterium]